MKNYLKITTLILLAFLSLTMIGCSTTDDQKNAHSDHSDELYTCGMHPNVIQVGPGTCPICGMYLTPLNNTSDEKSDGTIKIDPVTIQNIGVRTAMVEKREISQHIRAFGKVEYDESQIGLVQTKYSGWVEKLYFSKTGQSVKKGDVLLEIYSPLLVTAQEEYLALLKKVEGHEVNINLQANLKAARNRLLNFDISKDQIRELENSKTIIRTIEVRSPFDGIIESKHVENGMEVNPNMKLYSISNIENVWVIADIYENEAALIKPGLPAEIELEYMPGEILNGKVDYIYPYLDQKTRTVKTRLVVPNQSQSLKPGMYANVHINTEPIQDAIAVPVEAVIFSGNDNLVFIGKGEGEFAPRNVVLGIESYDGYFEIKEGLNVGEVVVTSAQFLLDSESKLQKNIKDMSSSSMINDHSQHIH